MDTTVLTAPADGASVSRNVDSSNVEAEGITAMQLISFAIGEEQYGVDIMAVREIRGWTDITPLPGQAEYVRGVLNLRGAIVPIVDLRCRFGQGETQATPLHIVIIVQIAETAVGLLADRVLDIVALDETQIKPEPRVAQADRASFLTGLVMTEAGMIALIDLPNLLSAHIEGGHAAVPAQKIGACLQAQ